jgi:predicted ATPase
VGWERTSAPPIERDRELSLLADAVTGLQRSHGSVVLVDGPAGIGKTRLLDAACELAREAGAIVLRARGVEVERAAPFGVVRQLLERQLLLGAARAELALGRREQLANAFRKLDIRSRRELQDELAKVPG